MLYLTTGTPGAGKSLWTIATVEARRLREKRPVYYYNIKELALDWNLLTHEQVLRWWELPVGSIIVIDEAQDIFPKGSSTQRPPEHADRIAKHRHGGYDIYLVSQHPMKLDANVRKDVEEHRHLMRKFGTHWVTVHLWKGCRDNCDKTRKDSITSEWRYPKEVFNWYKSAEVHTVRFNVPFKVMLMLLLPVGILAGFWWMFWGRDIVRNQPAPAEAAASKPQSASSGAPGGAVPKSASQGDGRAGYRAPQTVHAYQASYTPRVEGLLHTAPRYDELTAPVRVPVVVGCWLTGDGRDGWCITQQGSRVKPPLVFMRAFIAGGQFIDFEPGPPLAEKTAARSSADQPRATQSVE